MSFSDNAASKSKASKFKTLFSRHSDKKEGLLLAARFAGSLLQRLPECIDGNPVKMALSIVNIIIDIHGAVGDSNDALEKSLLDAEGTLKVIETLDSDVVKEKISLYRLRIEGEMLNLTEISEKAKAKKYLDYEKYKKDIETIVQRINIATAELKLSVTLQIAETTERMQKDLRNSLLDKLYPSAQANYRTVLDGHGLRRDMCTEGTRVDIRNNIETWANDRSPDVSVYWLTGQAGAGKTTIAQTIADKFTDDDGHVGGQATILGANFFCSQQFAETRVLNHVIPTIAYQLSRKYAPYADALYAADKFDSVKHPVSSQIRDLLVGPWLTAKHTDDIPLYLIVIDALDEVNGAGGAELLRNLLRVVKENRIGLRGLKFLITSRTNPEIAGLCATFLPNSVCRLQNVPVDEANSDIAKYLRAKLPHISGNKASIDLLAQLQERAQGLFIYAATVVKYLDPHKLTRGEQIQLLQDFLSGATVEMDAESAIDALYQQILLRAFGGLRKNTLSGRLRILYTFLCAAERIPTEIAASITSGSIDSDVAQQVLHDLHAVLYTSEDGRVFWYHTSFPDFVFDIRRSNFNIQNEDYRFWCDMTVHHDLMATECFHIIKASLRFNMCDISSSFLLDSEHISPETVGHSIGPVLAYSLCHWADHLVPPHTPARTANIISLISNFLQLQVLFWIEAMNLLKSVNKCPHMLEHALKWVLQCENTDHKLMTNLFEAVNFATYFSGSPAAESTPHLYISSLATWQESDLGRQWRSQFLRIPVLDHSGGQINLPLMKIKSDAPVKAIALSESDKHIAYASGQFVVIADLATGLVLRTLDSHADQVSSVAFSVDGTQVISGSCDKTIRVWDLITGTLLLVLEGHTNAVNSVAFSNNGTKIGSGSADGSVRVWSSTTGMRLIILEGHTDAVNSVAFSKDDARIVSGSTDRSVRIWDSKKGVQLMALEGHTGSVRSVAVSNDGKQIASGSEDHSVRVWDSTTGEQFITLEGHTQWVNSVAFSFGTQIVSGSSDQSVRVWESTTGMQIMNLEGHTHWVNSVAFSSNGTHIVSGSADHSVLVWDSTTGMKLTTLEGHTNYVRSVSFSYDGTQIASGSEDRSVRVWDAKTGEQLMTLNGHTEWVNSVAFSSDGSRIVSGSGDRSVRVWDSKTGAEIITLKGHTDRINSISISHDGIRIASGSADRSVRVWDSTTGVQLMNLDGHIHWVNAVAISNDGTRVVSGSADNSVRVWDLITGMQIISFEGHTNRVYSVAFSNDGTQIASGSEDQSVRIFDSSTGIQLRTLEGHTDLVNSVAFSDDGTLIVSGSNDKSTRVWDSRTGVQLKIMECHTGNVRSVHFSPDGKRIVSGTSGGLVQMWRLDIDPIWTWTHSNWIVSVPDQRRLIWVPDDWHIFDHSIIEVMIYRRGYGSFRIDDSAIGDKWHHCYTPSS